MNLILGVVTNNYDQDHPAMVQVSIPDFASGGVETAWLPVASPYAGKACGAYMMPEKDQQVIVGFLNGDPNCGVVLGSMWNAKNTIPPGVATEENILRAFVTKGGHSVTVKDGDEGGLTVKTKAGYKIEIAENDKTVIISTADSKQSVTLDENGGMVSIIADKKITLKAQEISLEGKLAAKGQAVSITSDGSLDIKGKQIKIDGSAAKLNSQNTEVTGAMVKVESSGILTLKGSMTKIN